MGHTMHAQLAFVSVSPCFLRSKSRVLTASRSPSLRVTTPRRLRAVACDRDAPTSSAASGSSGTSSSNGKETRTAGISRTLLGRAVVEALSLVVGAALLLVVVVWRASQVVSQAAWRALLWLGSLRRLGKWAFSRVVQSRLPADAAMQAAWNKFATLFSRLPGGFTTVSAPPRKESAVDVDQLVSKEDLDHVQREIDRMKDLIDSKGDAVRRGSEDVTKEAVETRRLILLRHAKTLWERDSDIPDHDRVLSAKGKEEARLVGSELVTLAWLPDTVLCSDAVRTVQTLSLLNVPEKEGQAGTLCTESLYYAVTGEEMAIAVDKALGEKGFVNRSTLMVVCHNPGCEELVEQLTGHRPEMGTGCAALLEFAGSKDTSEEAGQEVPFRLTPQQNQWDLVQVLRPSSLATLHSASQE